MLNREEQSFCHRWDKELELVKFKTGLDLNALCPAIELKAKTDFLPKKEDPGFLLLRNGYVKICHHEKGQDRAIRIAYPGALIGYGHWYLENPEHFKVTTITPANMTFYRNSEFNKFLDHSKNLNTLISESLVRTIMYKQLHIFGLEKTSSRDRVVCLILSLAENMGVKTPGGVLISVDVGRLTMAQLSGTTQVNLSRVLTELEEQKLIKRIRRSILIPDIATLRSLIK